MMEIKTKIIIMGHEEITVKCPGCSRGSSAWVDDKGEIRKILNVFDIISFDILTGSNNIKCTFCSTDLKVTVKEKKI